MRGDLCNRLSAIRPSAATSRWVSSAMHDSTCPPEPRPPAISEHTSISEGSYRTVVGSSRTAEASERSVERWHVRVERRSDRSPPSAVGEHTTIIEGEERAAEASDRSVERRRVRGWNGDGLSGGIGDGLRPEAANERERDGA